MVSLHVYYPGLTEMPMHTSPHCEARTEPRPVTA